MKIITLAMCLSALVMWSACNNSSEKDQSKTSVPKKTIERNKPKDASFTYQLDSGKTWVAAHKDSLNEKQMDILLAVNRTDEKHLPTIGKIIVPSDLTGDVAFYLPFPLSVSSLEPVNKILIFSYPAQAFAAYENGELVYAGPTNMGRKKDPTPPGLYYTNWKAEQTTSTFNDEWDLKWNFNIENKEGIGFHQYELPGYPASHSCLRLREKDAKYLYSWAEQWELQGSDNILAKGTPVVVFGSYPFDGEKPWLQLTSNAKALDISEKEVDGIVAPFMQDILAQQEKRTKYMATKK